MTDSEVPQAATIPAVPVPALTPVQWLLAVIGAFGIGMSKAGLTGVGLVPVLLYAFIFGALDSTGIILPMLITADVFAVRAFRQHTQWTYVSRMLPSACVGIAVGYVLMGRIDGDQFEPVIGWIILALTAIQIARKLRPSWFADVPHSRWFAWTMGLTAGTTTMMANAAGPIYTLYAMAVGLPKFELVGTGAWFFFIVNLIKVPFSAALGLIHLWTLVINLMLIPAIVAGLLAGRWVTERVPQQLFDALLLAFAALAALRLIGW